ncbi:MAG: phosphate propanoyltransferase [Eubacteriales bacterium]|nr:phosphate propanoyltransferase [Eubacteriales bacterium]
MIYHDITDEQLIAIITEAVQKELKSKENQVPVGISVRHIHLTRSDVDWLFGRNYQLTPKKALSQPGQFACEECLDIIGPKGTLTKVRVLGPERNATQVELSQTDCRTIGVNAPVRSSGDVEGTPGVILKGPRAKIEIRQGVIIADRHIHMTPADAERFGFENGDRVSVRVDGEKPGVIGNVLIRVSDKAALDMHLDTDDGNAFLLKQGQKLTVLGKENKGAIG